MTTSTASIRLVAGCLAATLLAACASDSNSSNISAPGGAVTRDRLGATLAAAAVAKLAKNLTGAQVRELLGATAATKPITAGGVNGETWSYVFRGGTETRMVPIATQEVAAADPISGAAVTRTEPVYQNQDVEMIDTLHLLIVDDRLIEWRVVREEQKKFH